MVLTRQQAIDQSRSCPPQLKGNGRKIKSAALPPRADAILDIPPSGAISGPSASSASNLIPEVVICNDRYNNDPYYSCFSTPSNVRMLCQQAAANQKRKKVEVQKLLAKRSAAGRECTPPTVNDPEKKRKRSIEEELDENSAIQESTESDSDTEGPKYKKRKEYKRANVIDKDSVEMNGDLPIQVVMAAPEESRKAVIAAQLDAIKKVYLSGTTSHIQDLRHLQYITESHVNYLNALVSHLIPHITKQGREKVKLLLERRSDFISTQAHFYSPHGFTNGCSASVETLQRRIQEYQNMEKEMLRISSDVANYRELPKGAIPPEQFYAKHTTVMTVKEAQRDSVQRQTIVEEAKRDSILRLAIFKEQKLVAASRAAYLRAMKSVAVEHECKSVQTK